MEEKDGLKDFNEFYIYERICMFLLLFKYKNIKTINTEYDATILYYSIFFIKQKAAN